VKFVLYDSSRQVSDRHPTTMTYREAIKQNTDFRNDGKPYLRWILHDEYPTASDVAEKILNQVRNREFDSLDPLESLFLSLAENSSVIELLDLAEKFDVDLDEEGE